VTHPRVADGGDGLQIRRTAANILNQRGQPTRWVGRRNVTHGLGIVGPL